MDKNSSNLLSIFLKIIVLCNFGMIVSCTPTSNDIPIIGTWKLLRAVTIQGNDTTIIEPMVNEEMIKMITPTHFSFMRHDTNQGKDSTAIYVSGGGRAMINDTVYTEYLDYCSFREWERGVFHLHYTIKQDTLSTEAIEKIDKLGINQINHETYIRVK